MINYYIHTLTSFRSTGFQFALRFEPTLVVVFLVQLRVCDAFFEAAFVSATTFMINSSSLVKAGVSLEKSPFSFVNAPTLRSIFRFVAWNLFFMAFGERPGMNLAKMAH